MGIRWCRAFISTVIALSVSNGWHIVAAGRDQPNIVFILADDLGCGDVGCYGQALIKTPHLDRLALEGMRFERHFSGSAVCAPSRCVLLTGLHPGHASIRNNRETKPEGQWAIPENSRTLATRLKARGYATGIFGKWGLGGPGTTGEPLRQGFDRFYGYNCQAIAHNSYPTHLWNDRDRIEIGNPPFSAHDTFKPDERPEDLKNYRRFSGNHYAPDLIEEQAIAFAEEHAREPFFLYWPTTVPHLALQVPEESLKEYIALWDDPAYQGGRGYLPHATPRAAYAAMVTRMDRGVGRLLERLKALGIDNNTIVIFSSDNGPLYDALGGTDSEFFNSHKGLRGRKGSLYEGGVRVPCIVRWPGVVPAGTVSKRVTGFEDWMPTLLEFTGTEKLPDGIDGISFAATLRGEKQPEREFLYREFSGYGGQQSVIVGSWKAIRQKLDTRSTDITSTTELYDLSIDPTESHNVADEHPEVVRWLEGFLQREHVYNKDFPIRGIDAMPRGMP